MVYVRSRSCGLTKQCFGVGIPKPVPTTSDGNGRSTRRANRRKRAPPCWAAERAMPKERDEVSDKLAATGGVRSGLGAPLAGNQISFVIGIMPRTARAQQSFGKSRKWI